MNKHVTLARPNAAEFIRQQPPMVSVYARELYEAAITAEADYDSIRAPYRQKRLDDAWEEMKRVMGE